ncbi:MAG: hypothetical protein IT388_12155 [Nitrospirales bacterium]|nr:hypothetical protein [Nitrospirales bacterium]
MMSKKPAPFLLRLYQESEEDRIILEGLEKHAAIKGDKTRIIKKILFEYFSVRSLPRPLPRPRPGADIAERVKQGDGLREHDAGKEELSAFRDAERGVRGKPAEEKRAAQAEYPDEEEALKESLNALSALLL